MNTFGLKKSGFPTFWLGTVGGVVAQVSDFLFDIMRPVMSAVVHPLTEIRKKTTKGTGQIQFAFKYPLKSAISFAKRGFQRI